MKKTFYIKNTLNNQKNQIYKLMPNIIQTPIISQNLKKGTVLFDSGWKDFESYASSNYKWQDGVNPNTVNFGFLIDLNQTTLNTIPDLPNKLKPIISVLDVNNNTLGANIQISQTSPNYTYPPNSGWFWNNQFLTDADLPVIINENRIDSWNGGYHNALRLTWDTDDGEETALLDDNILVIYEKKYISVYKYKADDEWHYRTLDLGFAREYYVFKPWNITITSSGISGSGIHYFFDVPEMSESSIIDVTPTEEGCSGVNFADLIVEGTGEYGEGELRFIGLQFNTSKIYSLDEIEDANFYTENAIDVNNFQLYILTHMGDTNLIRNDTGTTFYKVLRRFAGLCWDNDAPVNMLSNYLIQEVLPNGNIEYRFRPTSPTVDYSSIVETPSLKSSFVKNNYVYNPELFVSNFFGNEYITQPVNQYIISGQLSIKPDQIGSADKYDLGWIESYILNEDKTGYIWQGEPEEEGYIRHYIGTESWGLVKNVKIKCQIIYCGDDISTEIYKHG